MGAYVVNVDSYFKDSFGLRRNKKQGIEEPLLPELQTPKLYNFKSNEEVLTK